MYCAHCGGLKIWHYRLNTNNYEKLYCYELSLVPGIPMAFWLTVAIC